MYQHHLQHISSFSSGSQFWGAFLGAFFAFVFGLIAYQITKRWERFVQHKNALVKLERLLNHHYNALAILEQLAADTSLILDQGKMTSNRFFDLKIPADVDLELASIDIINKFFSYQSYIDRHNINVSTFNTTLTRFEDLLIAGQPLHLANLEFTKKMLDGFKKELPSLAETAKSFLVLVRVHIAKIKMRDSFLYGVIRRQWDFDISKDEVVQETKKLEQEINQIQEDFKQGKIL
jgi:hypothetical protein